jgi:hypothetical protein
MDRNLHTKPLEQRNFIWFSQQIDEIKKPISWALGWVLEYQKNEDQYISINLFNSNNKKITQLEIENTHMFIQQYNNQIKRIKEELILEENISEAQKEMLLHIIEWIRLRIILLYYATYIEAEKWGYNLDIDKKIEYLKKIEKIETILYGAKISDSPQEKDMIIKYLQRLYNTNKNNLNEQQIKVFESFLKKSWSKNDEENEWEGIRKEEKIVNSTIKTISKRDVCDVFKKVLDVYGIKNKIIIIKENINWEYEEDEILYIPKEFDQQKRQDIIKDHKLEKVVKIILNKNSSNFSVGDYKIEVPNNDENISIKRVCELIDHEIGIHLPRFLNKDQWINIKTEWYLETEEGVATMNEKLATQKREDIETDEPTIHNTSTYIAENYNFEETKDLVYIYYLLQGKTAKEAEKLTGQRVLRVKRYHAFDLPWANRKDVVYRRWLADAVKYIKDIDKNKKEDIVKLQGDISNFFIAKLGKEETRNAEKIFAWFSIDKDNLIMPMAIGKIINEKLLWKMIHPDEDIRFLASNQKLNYQQKKKILEIVNFLKGSSDQK